MYEFTPVGWLKHCVFHPVEGFEDLRWKKQGSMKISMLIVLFLFIAMVVDRQLTGFQFNDSYVKVFNVVPLIVQSVVYFFTWVLGNWAICTLLDGEGTLKKIWYRTSRSGSQLSSILASAGLLSLWCRQ